MYRYFILIIGMLVMNFSHAETISKGVKLVVNSDLPIENFCSTEGKKIFTAISLLDVALIKTMGASIDKLANLFCNETKVYTLKEIIPYKVNENYIDKYVFKMVQKNGCSFQMIFLKNKNGNLKMFNEGKCSN